MGYHCQSSRIMPISTNAMQNFISIFSSIAARPQYSVVTENGDSTDKDTYEIAEAYRTLQHAHRRLKQWMRWLSVLLVVILLMLVVAGINLGRKNNSEHKLSPVPRSELYLFPRTMYGLTLRTSTEDDCYLRAGRAVCSAFQLRGRPSLGVSQSGPCRRRELLVRQVH